MRKRRIFYVAASAMLFTGALAQTPNNAQHFAKDGLSFDYPAGWTMDESKTTGQMQYLTLGKNGYATIMVRSPRAQVDSPDKETQARQLIQEGFVSAWAKNFTDNGAKPERTTMPTEIGGGAGECTRLSASLGGEPGRVDVCWRMIEKRMVQLAIVGSNRDIDHTVSAWDVIRKSIKIESATPSIPTASPSPGKP